MTGEKLTLFITLRAKALDSRSKHPILGDTKACEIFRSITHDFDEFGGFGNGNIIVIRAKQIDEWLKDFLRSNPNAVVLNLGCGLDTRISRINPSSNVSWFDLDFPEVIEERRNFFSEREGYTVIASPITDPGWLEKIPRGKPTIVIADGVLEYLSEEDVKTLLDRITNNFPHGQVIFDVMNAYAVKAGQKRLKERTGAVHKWGVENLAEVDALNPKLRRVDGVSLFALKYVSRLPLRYRFIFALTRFSPNMRNMLRLLRYEF